MSSARKRANRLKEIKAQELLRQEVAMYKSQYSVVSVLAQQIAIKYDELKLENERLSSRLGQLSHG